MRTLLILGFIGCIYLHFKSKGPELQHHDSLSTKQSAIKNLGKNKIKLPAISHVQNNSPSPASTGFVPSENDQIITEADVQPDYDEDDLSQ